MNTLPHLIPREEQEAIAAAQSPARRHHAIATDDIVGFDGPPCQPDATRPSQSGRWLRLAGPVAQCWQRLKACGHPLVCAMYPAASLTGHFPFVPSANDVAPSSLNWTCASCNQLVRFM